MYSCKKIFPGIAISFVCFILIYYYSSNTITVNTLQVEQSIDRGKTFLQHLQQPDGSIADTTNTLFDIWETTVAGNALFYCTNNANNAYIKKAIDYLQSMQNKNGLICHNGKCQANYCIETSALMMQLLYKVGLTNKLQKALDTVVALQMPNGSWLIGNPAVREHKDFPSATAFALNMIGLGQRKNNIDTAKAIQWLLSKQQQNGSWGKTWEYYNVDVYTLWAITQAMPFYTGLQNVKVTTPMIELLLSTQHRNGAWGVEIAEDEIAPPKIISQELETALSVVTAISLLAYSQDKQSILSKSIKKGIQFLLKKQMQNGCWNGGFFPIDSYSYQKKEYVFATSMAIIALSKFVQANIQ